MANNIPAQIAGQIQPGLQAPQIPQQPGGLGGQDLAGGLAALGTPPGQPGLPGGLDPATAEAAMQADQIFQSMTGQSFLELSQGGNVPPEMVELFMGLVEQVIKGTTTGRQEAAVTSPQSVL